MARIGLASDSYGNLEALATAFALFGRAGVDRVFFLGGWWKDVDAVLAGRSTGRGPAAPPAPPMEGETTAARLLRHPLAGRITRVASRACPEYGSGALGKVVDLLEGRIYCLVHDKADLTRDDIGNATLLFHGKSGKAGLAQFGPRIFVTPGRLVARDGQAEPATFALAEITPAELVLTVYSAGGAELRRERASLQPGGKVTVR